MIRFLLLLATSLVVYSLNLETPVAFVALLVLLGLSAKHTRVANLRTMEFRLCLGLAFLWLYGLCLGFAGGNSPAFILRNFVALSFYPMLYVLLTATCRGKFPFSTAIEICGAVCVAVATLILVAVNSEIGDYIPLNVTNRLGDGRYDESFRVYFLGCTLLCAYISYKVFAWQNATGVRKLVQIITIVIVVTLISILTQSKGWILAALASAIVPLALSGGRDRPSIYFFLGGSVSIVFLIIFGATYIFTETASGNELRYEQLQQLWSEVSFFGEGLGATLKSGYVRSEEFPYGFELSFYDVAHKLGVFSLLIFYCFTLVIVKSIHLMWTEPTQPHGYVAFGLMAYLIPATGNPILFAVSSVFSHVSAMYILAEARRTIR
jgi:hypothetical protein